MSDSRPTFRYARLQHQISLHMLIEDTQLDPRAVLLMDKQNLGTPENIDRLLLSLTRLSGKEYSRRAKSLSNVTFKLYPDYESISQHEMIMQLEADHQALQAVSDE